MFAILPDPEPTIQPEGKRDDADNFRWGLMGFISAFPLFNWLAWIFAAVDSDNPRLYYWFAALYALPLLRNGFDFDWFTWAMLGAGVVHVQAARIAATEPEVRASIANQLKPLNLVKTTAKAASAAAKVAFGVGQQPPPAAAAGSQQQQRQQQIPGGQTPTAKEVLYVDKDLQEEEAYNKRMLEEFDQQLQQRERQKDM